MDRVSKIKKLRHNIRNSIPLNSKDKEFIDTMTKDELIDIINVYDTYIKYLKDFIIDLDHKN